MFDDSFRQTDARRTLPHRAARSRTVGEVFVERVDAAAGYGAGTAPVRLTAQGRR